MLWLLSISTTTTRMINKAGNIKGLKERSTAIKVYIFYIFERIITNHQTGGHQHTLMSQCVTTVDK